VLTFAIKYHKVIVSSKLEFCEGIFRNNVNAILVKPGDVVELSRALETDIRYKSLR